MGNQHIISLEAENVKRIRAASIETTGAGTVVLTGSNGAGKSSILDSICMALNGGKAIPAQPIRNGAKKASIVLKTEELEITRTFTANGSYLEVSDSKGTVKSPQALLDKMVSLIGFDPLAFARMDPKAQAKELLRVCPIKIDLEQNTKEAEVAYGLRHDANREVKRLEGALASMPTVPDSTPADFVSVESLADRLAQLNNNARELAQMRNDVSTLQARIASAKAEIARLQAQMVKDEATLARKTELLAAEQDPSAEIESVTRQMKDADRINADVRAAKRRAEVETELKQQQAAAKHEDSILQELAEVRAKALAEAPFPVSGLSISDAGVVLLNGVPFSQASTSEQIRVGIKLAAAANPTLRVAFIRDGSLLDSHAMHEVSAIAQEHDLQIWVERVDDSSPTAIQVVDGETVAVDSK